MTVDTVIAAGRTAAEALMVCSCRITRFTPVSLNTVTFRMDDLDPSDDLIYEGPCRFKSASARVFTHDAEGQIIDDQNLLMFLPVDGTGQVAVDDRVEVTDGGPDASLTGRAFRVKGLFLQTYATARRIPVEALT